MDDKVIKSLDLNKYITWFVNEFMTYFPGIYNKDELLKIVEARVTSVKQCTFDDDILSGNYNEEEHCICVLDENNEEVLFHEFVHALRSYYFNCDYLQEENDDETINGYDEAMRKFHLADEGATELVTILYKHRKQRNNPNLSLIKPVKNEYFPPYMMGALIYNQLSMFYKLRYPDADLLKSYLKGDNIYKFLFDIIYEWISSINDDEDESLECSYRISNIILTYLADFGETNELNQDSYEKLVMEHIEIEDILKNVFMSIPSIKKENSNIRKFLGNSFLYAHIPSTEERLLNAILNVDEGLMNMNMVNDFISNHILSFENEERS